MSVLVSSSQLLWRQLAIASRRVATTTTPCFSFAKLSEAQKDDGTPKYTNSKEYYEYLLRFTPPDERGYMKFNSLDLNELIKIAHDEEDIKSIRTAYYNFIGHKVTIKNSQVDRLVEKAIKLSCAPLLHEILKNHNYLMYYPQTSLINQLASHYLTSANVDGMLDFSKIFVQAHFLKINAATLDSAATLGLSSKNNGILFNVAQAAYTKDITDLTPTTINAVLASLARHRLSGEQKETSGNRVETKFLQHLKKCTQSYHTIIGKAYLAIASKEIDGALVALADFNLIDKSKINASETTLINNDELTVEVFDQLIAAISDAGKQKYIDRLVKVIGDIQSKLGQSAVHSDITNKVQTLAQQQPKQEAPAAEPAAQEQATASA